MAEVARDKGMAHAAKRWETAAAEAEASAEIIAGALANLGMQKRLDGG
jgi:hypothetical protein